MTGWQILWLVAVDALLVFMGVGAWAEFLDQRDPVDSRFACGFVALAFISIPLFVL